MSIVECQTYTYTRISSDSYVGGLAVSYLAGKIPTYTSPGSFELCCDSKAKVIL